MWVGPTLIFVACVAQGLAIEPAPTVPSGPIAGVAAAGPSYPLPGGDYLLSLGPYGAMVWGAYMLGKGVRVTVQIELSNADRRLLAKLLPNAGAVEPSPD